MGHVRGGDCVPEDRLHVALIGVGFLVPVSLILFGIAEKYYDGVLTISLMIIFLNGIAVRLNNPLDIYFSRLTGHKGELLNDPDIRIFGRYFALEKCRSDSRGNVSPTFQRLSLSQVGC